MGFWIRDKKDGQKTAGYGVFLVCGVLTIGIVVYIAGKLQVVQEPLQAARAKQAKVAGVDTIVSSSTGMQTTKSEERPRGAEEISARGVQEGPAGDKTKGGSSAAVTQGGRSTGATAVIAPTSPSSEKDAPGGIESINVAMRIAEDASKPQLEEGGGFFKDTKSNAPRYQELQRTVWAAPEAAGTDSQHSGSKAGQTAVSTGMVVYSSGTDSELVAERQKQTAVDQKTDRTYVVPRGEWIPCFLLTTIDSDIEDTMIELGVAAPVIFNHRKQIPFGARIFASNSGKAVRMRMSLTATAIRYPNGLELPLSGAVRGEDRSPGVAAYYIAASDWAQISPFVSSFMEAWIDATKAEARGTGGAASGLLGILTGAAGVSTPTKEFNPKAEAGIAAATGLNEMLKARFKDIQERFGAHMTIPAGTFVWVQLTEDANFAEAHVKPKQPWNTALPAVTQIATATRKADTARISAQRTSAAASNGTSSIDKLIQEAANGSVGSTVPDGADAASDPAAKSEPSSVINKQPASDAQDFFPSKTQ